MHTDWRDVLGGYLSANQALDEYAKTRCEGEALWAWMERMSRELWAASGEHVDEDWAYLAGCLESEAAGDPF